MEVSREEVIPMAFKIGDRVYYLLPFKMLPATIVNATPKRVVIKCDDYPQRRSVKAENISLMSNWEFSKKA